MEPPRLGDDFGSSEPIVGTGADLTGEGVANAGRGAAGFGADSSSVLLFHIGANYSFLSSL